MSFLDELNPMQRKAAEITEGPLLILAGAGSGKTRTVIYRIAHLLTDCGVRPYQILALTFTNKAAGEMRSRIERFDIPYTSDMWMGTFHSICARILRIHAADAGYKPSFTIYDETDSKAVAKQCLADAGISEKVIDPDRLRGLISMAKNNAVGPEDFLREFAEIYRAKDIASLYGAYQKKLRENNAMDFDDLLFNTYRMFLDVPQVLEYYQDRFRYILVDEYQDTNRLQYEIIALVAQKHRNICVCGDDDQSIYGWRGADIRNILEFEEDFPNASVVRLEQNYRSTSTILEAANRLISHNKGRKGKNLWTEAGAGEKIHVLESARDLDEAQRVVYEINRRVGDGLKYSDIAVLYRTNAQSRVIEEGLIRAEIPYQIVRGTRFYDRLEVKDIMSYLRMADNPYDEVSFIRSTGAPKRGIGSSSIEKLRDYASFKGISLMEAARDAGSIPGMGRAAVTKLGEYCEVIDRVRRTSESDGLAEAVKELITASGYMEYLRASHPDDSEGRLENLNELVNAASDFEQTSEDSSIGAFLENAALISGIDNVTDDEGQVLLMSIHNSKGLEFRCVFVVGVEEGLFPLSKAAEDPASLEEERRLCYVAMTRAMDYLYLSFVNQRRQYGMTRPAYPSRFLGEIPPELTDAEELRHTADDRSFFSESLYARPPQKTPPVRYEQKPPAKKALPVKEGDYAIADRVEHPIFGTGTVIDITRSGEKILLTLAFAGLGIKKIDPSKVEMKKIR